ncbi:glycosyl hydrolase family 28-related protein [Caldibacillus debilis]|uniref:glycosyl hydrolase family 28-related protein n=1 Tax=Caldibacillus debilis TaxID=301148 RepID=UPI000E38308C|nr:glycosyl hydrolase family 28-related protein [Caldibacillus debilis]REJ29291.1 MAG: hypothetical protein C6W56_06070 [Caldibacillus debilis]
MAIPETIKKLANDIRTKIYGREVREALAQGIEAAGDLADKANTKSENAVYQVNNIQAQVNQLVVEGDSSVEAAQARVDADGNVFTTLKERLDTKETQFANKISILKNTFVSVEEFGAVGDGIQDDYQAIQNALDYAGNNGIRKVVFQKRSYRITNILQVPSGVEIDGNGATLLFDNVNNLVINPQNNRSSWFGMINIHGELTTLKTDITSYQSVLYKEDIDSLRVTKSNNFLGKWGVTDASIFSVGDFVVIQVPFRPNSINELIPVAEVLARIEYISGNYIYTDYYSPYDWSNYTFVPGKDILIKVNPKKNVYIHDIVLKDDANINNRGTLSNPTGDAPNRYLYPCGVGVAYAYNVKVENVVADGLVFSGVTHYFTHSCSTKNLEVVSPKSLGGGEGYATQNMNVMNLVVEQVRSFGAPRHLVDISSGYFCKIRDCIAQTTTAGAFDLHGEGEHHIEFENCVGGFRFGNSLQFFNELGHGITVKKSKITLHALGYYTNVRFEDCEVTLNGWTSTDKNNTSYPELYSPQVKFENCVLYITQGSSKFSCQKRGTNINSYFEMNNSRVNLANNYNSYTFMEVRDYDRVNIQNNDLCGLKGWGSIAIIDSKKAFVDNNILEDGIVFVYVQNLRDFIDYTISRNKFIYTDYFNDKNLANYQFIIRDDFPGCKGIVRIRENTVESKQTTFPKTLYFIDLGRYDNSGADIDFDISGNCLKSGVSNALGFRFDLRNTRCRYTSSGNVVQGTIKVEEYSALPDEIYKKSVLRSSLQHASNGSGASAGYVKVGEFTVENAGHVHFAFDWLAAQSANPSSGRVVGMVDVNPLGSTPTNVKIVNTKFGATNQVNGTNCILVQTAISPTSHTFAIYMYIPAWTTFVFSPVLSYNIAISWSQNKDVIRTLPTGTQWSGIDANV